ncbi:hypothetical protein SAMN04487976_1395 [Xaviernesmea oryzae]|nr:hypothetical protein SAMN04487976_1395 [Xaviernesmea oryzae]
MTQIIDQNSENQGEKTSAPPLCTGSSAGVSAPQLAGGSAIPSPAGGDHSMTHLTHLTDRARGYVEAASSANTRRAYAADWKHFSAWCRRSGLSPLPPASADRRPLHHRLRVRHQ